jgi:hypothetical protein
MGVIPYMAKLLDLLQSSYRVAERRNRTLMDVVRSMISYSTLR